MICRLLTFLFICISVGLLNSDSIRGAESFKDIGITEVQDHPRLFWGGSKENEVRDLIKADSLLAKIHNRILSDCDNFLKQPLLKYEKKGVRLLDVSREAQRRIVLLSYLYRITNDGKYADQAAKEMMNVCGFSDWNPSHFLDVAEMALGVAVGYDWLYDRLDENQREAIAIALNEKAFIPSSDKNKAWFYRAENNWNSVCNAGLVCAAISVMDEMPQVAGNIIGKCLDTNNRVLATYAPDGGYPEGCNYWGYGTLFEVLLIDALHGVYGSDFGLSDSPGFMQSAKFMQFMTAPSGQCFNFSDAGATMPGHVITWWFADKTNDNSLLWLTNKRLSKNDLNLSSRGLLPLALIFASRGNVRDVAAPEEHFWLNRGKTPVFAYRSGWDSKNDTYLAVKGGSASTTHAHMDAGSFVFEHDGVRWAMDLGSQDYHSIEKEGIKLWGQTQDAERWEIMRMRNDCHNTLTVDSARHIVNAHAEIIDTLTSPSRKGAVVDLTSTLGKVRNATRTVYLDNNDNLIVKDSISTTDEPIELTWVMVTPANAKVSDGKSVLLYKDDKEMKLSVDSPIPVKMRIWSNEPMHYYDAPNNGTVRVGYTTEIPANFNGTFVVKLQSALSVQE